MQRAGLTSVLSGVGRDNTVLAAILSLPIGVGRCETQRIGYTCRRDVPTIFGQGFNSPRLHQTELARPRASNVRGDISLPYLR
jgi:hypothetical protein